jgi:hypothetical protein
VAATAAIAALLLAPSVWAVDTLGHATSSTFPEGGPANVQTAGGGMFGGRGAPGALGRGVGGPPGLAGAGGGAGPGGAASGEGSASASGSVPLFGNGTGPPATGSASSGEGTARAQGAPPGLGLAPGAARGAGGFGGPMGGGQLSSQVLSYVKQHGGGTIAVSSQTSASSAIIASGAKVAGIGGFSGRESSVTTAWLSQRVRSGSIRWVFGEQSGAQSGRGLPGDTRAGSKAAIAAVEKVCKKVTLSMGTATAGAGTAGAASGGTGSAAGSTTTSLYDCQGRAGALANAGS